MIYSTRPAVPGEAEYELVEAIEETRAIGKEQAAALEEKVSKEGTVEKLGAKILRLVRRWGTVCLA